MFFLGTAIRLHPAKKHTIRFIKNSLLDLSVTIKIEAKPA